MELFNLTNEQLVYIYHDNKKVVDKHERMMKEATMMSPKKHSSGLIVIDTRPMTLDELNTLKQEPNYIMRKSIMATLAPIIDLLQDSEPELVREYGDTIFKRRQMQIV